MRKLLSLGVVTGLGLTAAAVAAAPASPPAPVGRVGLAARLSPRDARLVALARPRRHPLGALDLGLLLRARPLTPALRQEAAAPSPNPPPTSPPPPATT